MNERELVSLALEVRKNAYAPYSGFHVGAALLSKDGRIFKGCNVESVSFGAGMCAERSAVAQAVSSGAREFSALAVAGNGEEFCVPCGICRQLLIEFGENLPIICANENGDFKIYQLFELLPNAFSKI